MTTAVDSKGSVGDTCIAIDTSNKVHISYSNWNNKSTDCNLKYATNASGLWVKTTVGRSNNSYTTSISLDSSDKAHISYYGLTYATNAVQSAECTPASITATPNRLKIKVNESGDVVVTVNGKDDCLAEGVTVDVKLTDSGKKKVSVSPEEGAVTDANGEAKFTFTGIKKGKAKVTFNVEDLDDKEKITVKVK